MPPPASALASTPAAVAPAPARNWPLWLGLATFAILWLDLIRQLSYEWSTNEQYAYGWFVPVLAACLFIKKWPTRPPASGPDSRVSNFSFQLSAFNFFPRTFPISDFLCLLSAFCFLLFLLPLRIIFETNQDWPLISWPLTLCVVGLSLYAIYLAGGKPWLKHFAFPVCFILVAVQWPYRLEHGVTQSLMRLDTNITVELLGWLNIPALQRGNLIELATCTVGVDEACSGIRSFQSTLMAGLFMGELYLLRPRTRLGLVIGGLVLAFCFNVIRTLFLAWNASASGLSAIDKWHDPAGFTITIACFFALWLLATYIAKKTTPSPPSASPPPTPHSALRTPHSAAFNVQLSSSPPSPPHSALRTPHSAASSPLSSERTFPLSAFNFQLSALPSPTPHSALRTPHSSAFRFQLSTFSFLFALWVPFTILATELWYGSHETGIAQTAQWWVNLPTNSPSYRTVPISASARKLLKNDQEACASWDEQDGAKWSVFCLRWNPGDPTARMSAQGHRPEYCMTGSGHQMNEELGISYLPVNGLKLPFRSYVFDAPERPLYVFFCLWEDGAESQVGFGKSKQGDRLRSVLNHRRGLGQQTLEIICSGYESMDQAKAAVTARLPELIKAEPTQSVASDQ